MLIASWKGMFVALPSEQLGSVRPLSLAELQDNFCPPSAVKIQRNAAGQVVEVELTNGKRRQFRYHKFSQLMWISEGEDQYFRPDTNGSWLRKTARERYIVNNLRVDSAGVVYYDRECTGKIVHCVEKLDSTRLGFDDEGRIVRIYYPNGTFRGFEYNARKQLCRYISTDGTTWNANDELLWRQWPTCRNDVHGVVQLESDGTFRFLKFSGKRDELPNLTICKPDGTRINNLPISSELRSLLQANFELMPLNENGKVSKKNLYEILRDRPVSGEMRVAATLLWDFACRYGRKEVSKEQILTVVNEDDLGERAALMVARTVRLRNLYRVEDNNFIKRLSRFPKIASATQR